MPSLTAKRIDGHTYYYARYCQRVDGKPTPPNGIMTGASDLPFASANITIRPGAFCDHLTSYAATFDINAQTKTSEWIARGASGSSGTVEEPCNYLFKFPSQRIHVWYAQGLSLGESYLRSMTAVPFQNLFIGDPLTRPWAYIPVVTAPGLPSPAAPITGDLTQTVVNKFDNFVLIDLRQAFIHV